MVSQQPEPIAIVGSGCRFPGKSDSPSSLWNLLQDPRDISKEITQDRFDPKGYYHPIGTHHGTTNVRQSYLLDEDLRAFDATFFNISPNEADSIDPQQRLLLETVYEALESGGHPIEALHGSDTAVYVGNMAVDYHDVLLRDVASVPTYFATGTGRSILSNRISYFFNWHGPSMTIDTACSSSMIAVHQGLQSLRTRESRVAVACGAELILGPENYIAESKMNLLSPTGRSRMWDADADGYARGDGVAALIMKRLSDAIADGDHIECLVRETGTNQDGRSSGLTVPSSEAQAALIRQTYAKAGLDPENSRDRPQYFEAHGTGTKVGDPLEAAAIQQCLGGRSISDDPLYVGSIKTVIGHTEGTAGIAGLLKASLAIQHSTIPPNLLLDRLNPSVERYYKGLHVPTSAKQWPALPEGVPRRASVNSFGFGGSNAHAILEQYQPPNDRSGSLDLETPPFTPFTFSAVSEASLVSLLQAYSDFLRTCDDISLSDLAWTLQSRRSHFAIKATFSALNIAQLKAKIDNKLAVAKQNTGSNIGIRSISAVPRILGIFTGQGAQWATMGGQLIRSSAFVRERIKYLENSLATLPPYDQPQWSLENQILAEADTSRLAEAELSQPLCTAIQIVLVDLLRSAGIEFQAVVGHSSGEIAAAYAADFVSAHDAIRIAYYRGLHARLAGDPSGQKGAMLAAGTSYEDAEDLIKLPFFRNRLNIAACNSSASVTLSGNADAIIHAKKVFDEEKKFARLLKVDTAYHSHHMYPCGDPYIQSLRACGVHVNWGRRTSCAWYSSVIPGKEMQPAEDLQDIYWRDNMTNAVQFAEAVKTAASDQLNLALEVGPHPALQGPASQNIADVRSPIPYCGVLGRGQNDVEAFSDALGFIWAQLGSGGVNFQAYESKVSNRTAPKLLVDLPSYQWNRARTHWYESRTSKKTSKRPAVFHELLGVQSPDSTDRDRRWTNVLKTSEVLWLDGHQLQGQTVFPAAGYVAMALEAAKSIAGDRAVELFEVNDLTIRKAITFEDDTNFAVETLVTLTAISPSHQEDRSQTADFSCYSCSSKFDEMELMASGSVKVEFGIPSATTLSSTPLGQYNMTEVDADQFYSSLLELGYGYTGPFQGMSSLKRRLHQTSASVATYAYTDAESAHLVHPTMLDVAFQASLLAQSAPGDGALWSLHVPTSIRSLRVNPQLCASLPTSGTQLPICAQLHQSKSIGICGSVDIFSEDAQQTLIQIEDLTLVPFAPATMADDRHLFSYTAWGLASPDGTTVVQGERPSTDEAELARMCERIAYYYVRKWKSEMTDNEWTNGQPHHQSLRNYMDHTLSSVSTGRHPCIKKEWSNDTYDEIKQLIDSNPENVDIKLILAVGENIPAVVRGQTTMLEHMLRDNMLDDLYKKGIGFAKYNSFLAKIVQQITYRYPHAKILEIGAGTGGATKTVLEQIGNTFSSYTYTDISAGFFEKAAELFRKYSDKMTFKVFDAETTPATQGFEVQSYDIVIASNVLHATASLHKTLENTRKLLKPGGYLLLLEITNNGPTRFTNMMGGLPGWWIGVDDGRRFAPTITPGLWHTALRKSGYSGVDAITPEIDGSAWPFSIIATQAVDDKVDFLRRPLSPTSSSIYLEEVIILGSGSLMTAQIAEEVSEHLGTLCGKITILEGLPTETNALAPMSTFINLIDLDSPIFRDVTAEKMNGLQRLLELSKHILWITSGAQADNPYHMSSISFSRTISHEMPHITLNHLDVSESEQTNISKVIAEYLLRQCAIDEWEAAGLTSVQMLWSKEPEFHLERGQLTIPRILPNADQNARLNSSRRAITKTLSTSSSNVSILPTSESTPSLLEETLPVIPNGNKCAIRVDRSSFIALHVAADTFLYLSIGKEIATGDTVVALAPTNGSVIAPVAKVVADFGSNQASSLLIALASELFTISILRNIPQQSHLLVHDSGKYDSFITALRRRAAAKGVRVSFSTSTFDGEDPTCIKLKARAPKHTIRRLLPAKITHFLDLTGHIDSKGVSLAISEALPLACKRVDPSNFFQNQSIPPNHDRETIPCQLQDALSCAKKGILKPSEGLVTQLHQLDGRLIQKHPTSIIDWTTEETLSIPVRALSPKRLFSRDKTYLLIGLTGQLGQSLCEWMVRNGAGCMCLTSRRPSIDARWLESLRETGGTIKVLAMDVTNKDDLTRVVDEIRAECPPIAGVANAAMVLHDTLFQDMSMDMMRDVLQPKVDGTNNLDELFYNDDLDFFILFSSLACVVGNSGQANYAAATGYLTSLARQRRKRGLAASAFDIGRVVGVGYVERAGAVIVEQLMKYGYMAISESEFHQMFAETIRAGYPDLGLNPVVTTGIRMIRDDEQVKGPWFNNPRFSHCIVEAKNADVKQEDKKTTLPVSEQISNAASNEEALEVLKDCFSAKLRVILQISDQSIDHDAPLIQLGIDSLVAVEVRSWFLKELKVDMPVLKVLGGGSVTEICQQVLDKMPEKMLSNIGKESTKPAAKPPQLRSPQLKPQGESSSPSTYTPMTSSSPDDRSAADSSTQLSSRSSNSDLLESAKPNTSANAMAEPESKLLKSEQISFSQSRFWFLGLLLEDQTTFNVAFYYKIAGNLRIGDLERAVRAVGTRHEGLRTCFIGDETEADLAYQKVMDSCPLRLEHKEISSIEDVAVEYAKLKAHIFDIASGSMMRIVLLTLSPSSHYLLINYHHILMDGGSYSVFLSDLEKAYKGQSLGPLPRQFPDFSRDQRKAFENGEMSDEQEFWRGEFPGGPPVLPLLPMAKPSSRLPLKAFDVHQVEHQFDAGLVARIKSMSKVQRSTPFHFFLAVYKIMLFCFTDADNLTIGIADANRNDSDVAGTIGFFLNLLTLHFRRQPSQCFADAVQEARNITFKALGHSRLPFDVLLKELNLPRSSAYSPFFQAFFDYRQGDQAKHAWGNCQFEVQEMHPGRTAYDITLDITNSSKGALVLLRAQKSLYDLAAAELLLETYIHLLGVLSSDPSLSLEDTPLFSEKQLTHAVELGRGPNLTSDWPRTLPHRIDQIAHDNPDKVALVDGLGRVVMYADMISRIEAISEALQRASICSGSRVLVFQQATSDWVCSMLAIMRVGGVYVPLDIRNPLPRLAGIAHDCEPRAVLIDDTMVDNATQLNVHNTSIINVSQVGLSPSATVPNSAQADSPAAILYTSGSTGKPKGITVKHSGLRNEIEGYTKMWELGAERVLQQSAFTFNHSSDQIYTGLVNGGMVYIVPISKRGDPLEITEIIHKHGITYTKATPSEYSMWVQYGGDNLRKASDWRKAFGGGEPLTGIVTQQLADLSLPQLRFFNSYGPTEISISSTKMEIAYRDKHPEGRVPCGYSLPNYVIYVLDENLKPVPAGMPGELVIGGAGVSLGYLNNKELTDEHFVSNPYATPYYIANGWTQMYRTGDIGHLQGDGAMVFHSRKAGDDQVKIRGLRIELSDIESNILSGAGGVLTDAVVTLYEGDTESLVAHVVFAPQHNITDKEAFLQRLLNNLPLPQYMIPVLAIPLDQLPLTNHSKVDRKAIKNMPLPQRAKSAVPDLELSETMLQLKRVWQSVLGNKELGLAITPMTSFFVVGGNSLLIIRLQARIREVFGVVIRLVELLGANTLGEMACKIEESSSVCLIDWEKETTLPEPDTLKSANTRPVRADQKTVLLTGATGFLAKFVLPELAANSNVQTIHRIAVRDKPSETPRKLASSSSKIVSHPGDLSAPMFGLSEDEFRTLSNEVDVILHMGAVRSFWDNYHVLRPSNVNPTKELIKLAGPRGIPIHYISTASVLPRKQETIATSAAANVPAADGANGYVASRWASERILERAAEKMGLPVSVHRFAPSAQKQSSSGPAKQALDEFVRFVDISQVMPDFGGWDGSFDMIPAGQVAQWLCDAMLGERRDAASSTVQYSHYEAPITINVVEMKSHLEQHRGGQNLERMPVLRWIGRIKSLGFNFFLASQEVSVENSGGGDGAGHMKLKSRR